MYFVALPGGRIVNLALVTHTSQRDKEDWLTVYLAVPDDKGEQIQLHLYGADRDVFLTALLSNRSRIF